MEEQGGSARPVAQQEFYILDSMEAEPGVRRGRVSPGVEEGLEQHEAQRQWPEGADGMEERVEVGRDQRRESGARLAAGIQEEASRERVVIVLSSDDDLELLEEEASTVEGGGEGAVEGRVEEGVRVDAAQGVDAEVGNVVGVGQEEERGVRQEAEEEVREEVQEEGGAEAQAAAQAEAEPALGEEAREVLRQLRRPFDEVYREREAQLNEEIREAREREDLERVRMEIGSIHLLLDLMARRLDVIVTRVGLLERQAEEELVWRHRQPPAEAHVSESDSGTGVSEGGW